MEEKMSFTNTLLKLDRKQLELPKKKIEMPRLSKLLKEKLIFEIQGINQEKLDEITDMVSKIDLKTKNVDIDFVELKLAIICEGVKSPSFRDKEVMQHFGVSTPYDLVKLMLTSGERDALYSEIQELSGYNAEVIKEIKKQ
jgi:hypothetical protein